MDQDNSIGPLIVSSVADYPFHLAAGQAGAANAGDCKSLSMQASCLLMLM